MDRLSKIFVSGVTGTSLMTAASALMSLIPGEEFREPEHLAKMAGRIAPLSSKQAQTIAGWGAHYMMGFLFATTYVELWEKKKIKHNIRNGIVLGLLSGLVGIMIWKATFKIHPLPPSMPYLDFYLQRIPAHVVFAVFATVGYNLALKQEAKQRIDQHVVLH